jgi:hypothetical protein
MVLSTRDYAVAMYASEVVCEKVLDHIVRGQNYW